MWLMDGTNATFVGAVGPFNPGPSWEIKGRAISTAMVSPTSSGKAMTALPRCS
jgi:hypothetical protein